MAHSAPTTYAGAEGQKLLFEVARRVAEERHASLPARHMWTAPVGKRYLAF